MRYNKTAVDDVMNDEVKKISILRDPAENFVSSWRYYSKLTEKLRKMLPLRIEKMIIYCRLYYTVPTIQCRASK